MNKFTIIIFSLLIFVPFLLSAGNINIRDQQSGLIFSDYLIRFDNIIKIGLLKVSQSNMVVIGKDGWLFVDTDESMADYRGLVPYTESQLDYISGIVQSEKDYLDGKGIKLLLVVAPNKESIYPEFMPDNIKKGNKTRLDQLVQRIDILDLRPILKTEITYRKIDTHWNYYGAYLAYRGIISNLGLMPHELSDYELIQGESKSDLSNLLKMDYQENVYHLKLEEVESEKINSVLIFQDSFYETDLRELLAPHFNKITEVRYGQLTLFSSKLINEVKPDVVLYIMAERVVGRYFMPWK